MGWGRLAPRFTPLAPKRARHLRRDCQWAVLSLPLSLALRKLCEKPAPHSVWDCEKPARKDAGMTFVELIVSVLILGIALGAMLSVFVMGRTSAARAKHKVQAMNHLREYMEEIKGMAYSAVTNDTTLVTIDDNATSDTADDLIGSMTVAVIEHAVDGYKEAITTLTWTERTLQGAPQITEELTTYIAE